MRLHPSSRTRSRSQPHCLPVAQAGPHLLQQAHLLRVCTVTSPTSSTAFSSSSSMSQAYARSSPMPSKSSASSLSVRSPLSPLRATVRSVTTRHKRICSFGGTVEEREYRGIRASTSLPLFSECFTRTSRATTLPLHPPFFACKAVYGSC
jgi:hypothetical protein